MRLEERLVSAQQLQAAVREHLIRAIRHDEDED
jgi:hypothetical protein